MTFSRVVRDFIHDRRGSVATFMAVAVISIVGAGGIAVDYSRVAQSRAGLNAAADAAALAGARTQGSAADREGAARTLFESNIKSLKHMEGISFSPENIVKNGVNSGFRVTVSGTVKTMFGGVFGVDQWLVKAMAEAEGAISASTEIAMVLDTTGSMSGWKIDTLKTASRNMVDSLSKLAPNPEQLKFSIIPFAEYVNIGMGNRNKPWLNVPADYQDPGQNVCWMDTPVIGQTNCRVVNYPATPGTPPGTCYNDGVPYSCGGSPPRPAYSATVCDNIYGTPTQKCQWQQGAWHRWYGCVGSRNTPLDTQDGNYGVKIPGLMDTGCNAPIVELTSDYNSVKAAINGLYPNGETYIPAGLMWGWRMLSSQSPFEGKVSTDTAPVKKYIVLMTDGLNTRSPTYPYHWGNDTAQANTLTKQICANIASDKASNIRIYSVAFNVTDAATKQMLRDCALNTKGEFFDAQTADQFLAAFSTIGNNIAELRLTK